VSVELALKAALRLVNIEPPRDHDPSEVLRQHRQHFPVWFQDGINRFAAVAQDLAKDRLPGMYGDEEELIPPSELYTEAHAQKALADALAVLEACQRLSKPV